MVIITGWLSFPADQREDVLSSLLEVTVASRGDRGCLDYWWAEDLDDPNTFHFFECWATQADLDAHLAQPHETAWAERNMGRIAAGAATTYNASASD
jgi:quinol monooxygenase YgiN